MIAMMSFAVAVAVAVASLLWDRPSRFNTRYFYSQSGISLNQNEYLQ